MAGPSNQCCCKALPYCHSSDFISTNVTNVRISLTCLTTTLPTHFNVSTISAHHPSTNYCNAIQQLIWPRAQGLETCFKDARKITITNHQFIVQRLDIYINALEYGQLTLLQNLLLVEMNALQLGQPSLNPTDLAQSGVSGLRGCVI